jgi:hypothetical protein
MEGVLEKEITAVKELGERIGYGNMMTLASALWRKNLKDSGYPEIGAFVPTIYPLLTNEGKKIVDRENPVYDRLIGNTIK